MNFKKNAIRSAVGVAAVAGASGAMAGTWAPAAAPVYATEYFGTGNTTELVQGAAVYTLAAAVATGSQQIVYTLNGATWGDSAPTPTFTNASGTGAMTFALVDGGANTDSTATFRVTTGTATAINDTISLAYTLKNVTNLGTATTTAGPSMAFTISDTLGNVDTAGAATAVASSAAGTTTSATANAAPALIDVSNNSTQFTAGNTLSFNAGSFTIADLAGVANGVQANSAAGVAWAVGTNDAAVTNTTITVTGDFSASLGVDTNLDGNTSQGEGVTLSGGITANATTLTADTATFVVSGADTATAANSAVTVSVNVDGTTVIPEQSLGLTVAVDYTTAGLTDESLTASLASIAKDGSTAAAPLLLNPDGAYDNFIRVSNTGTVEGAVFATVTNDSGTSVTFTLIASLAAGASSDLISVTDLYSSAQAADATFDVGTGKLRGSFTGEFAGINVQNISLSTDGTTFFTF